MGQPSPVPLPEPSALRRGYVLIPLVALPLLGLLRSFNDATPRVPGLPYPFDSPLLWGALGLFALHLVHRSRGRDLMPDIERGSGLTLPMVLPVIVVALAEKWISIDLLGNSFEWIDARVGDPERADALYRLWAGLALTGSALLLYRIPLQVARKLERLLVPERILPALAVAGAAALGAGMLFTLLPLALGARVGVLWSDAGSAGLMAGSQALLGVGEELFFRGLLQQCLVRLLWQAGLPQGRFARLIAICTVSLAFTLEHADPSVAPGEALRSMLWVFAISTVLGMLLEASRNLYLVIAAHTLVNLVIAGLVPLPLTPEGQPALEASAPAMVFLVLLFVGVTLTHRLRGRV